MPRINILVEGADDVRFFERALVPVLRTRYRKVRLIPYASLKRVAVNRILAGLMRLGEDYLIVADIDAEPSVGAKKQTIRQRFAEADLSAIAIVVMEIESWYVAGAEAAFLQGCGLQVPPSTDDLTKERFNELIPERYRTRVEFMIALLDRYSVEVGAERNRSLRFFLKHYGPEALIRNK
jgi:hypothetical protein